MRGSLRDEGGGERQRAVQPSLRDEFVMGSDPNTEVLGYYQMSLRDKKESGGWKGEERRGDAGSTRAESSQREDSHLGMAG